MDTDLEYLFERILANAKHEEVLFYFKRVIDEKNLYFNWHPLGFVHSKIASIPNLGDLRLHVWPALKRKTQKPEMPIHDHVFKINSFILFGEIKNHIYKVTNTESHGKKYRIYMADYVENKSILSPTNQIVNCELQDSKVYSSGNYYVIEKDTLHQSEVQEGQFAATLVVTTEKDNSIKPNILGPLRGGKYTYEREQCELPIIEMLCDKLF
ncbi:hypothetical protein [Bacillus haynesii]|uniref:hypothetical protein n=1 Tax=Bacillus haynesii TaxID=1925021 RepID=UPI0022805248|nr:hypothetical protein [Bacillus haynesii]MCY7860538.1 hypothetical protein [Bacillus haynesii]MCY8342700.1 hypothetical protein [Bacillus haynesii]MCY9150417.1 hypothetical protein [Bacillus haynesii]